MILRAYQYAGPLVLTPLSYWLWRQQYHNITQVLVAWLLPILYAYIVPAVGTNICKVWEFDVRWKLGRFRPHHGFVFGSAAAVIAWLVHGSPAKGIGDVLRYALVLCSVQGFWNLLYEVKALRIGLLKVYNQPWANGQGEEAIAFDYAPWFFGIFGAVHGLAIAGLEFLTRLEPFSPGQNVLYFILSLFFCTALPVLCFIGHSFRRHGHSGIRPAKK